jgi:exodeoxyribonuclease III
MIGNTTDSFTDLNKWKLLFLFALVIAAVHLSAGERKFKILTYNVWQGYLDGKHPRFPCYESGLKRKEGIYNWLKQQNADVVFFQELIDYSSEKLKEECSFWGHKYAITLKNKGMAIGITSRFPIKVTEVLTKGMHHGLIYCNIDGIDIIATHLWPSFDEKILDEVNLVKQRVNESVQTEMPVIVLGDFNAFSPEDDQYINQETIELYKQWNWKLENGGPNYRVIQALLDLGLKDMYVKFRKRSVKSEQRYDFIFASPSLAKKCLNATHFQDEGFLKFSDHFPISAEFKVN